MIIGRKIFEYATVGSTNTEAKRLLEQGEGEGAVVLAEAQTAGRGKPGSGWFSAPGLGLYLSFIIKPYRNPRELGELTRLAARAVVRLIGQLTGLPASIKEPNDVLLNGKKICGILTERLAGGNIIVGIGWNLNHRPEDLPAELREKATSLLIEHGRSFPARRVADRLLPILDELYLAYLS